MLHVIKTGAAALAAATLVLAAAGTAQAATVRVDDAQGDVWKGTFGSHRAHWDEAGSALNADIDKTDIDHGVDTLTLTTTFKRLEKKKAFFQAFYDIRTDAGNEYGAMTYAGPHMWAGGHDVFDMSGVARPMTALRGTPPPDVFCPEATHDISYADDTVTVTIPRSCLGDPSWVKVQSLALSSRNNNNDSWWVDNGHNKTHSFSKGFSGQVAAEPPPAS